MDVLFSCGTPISDGVTKTTLPTVRKDLSKSQFTRLGIALAVRLLTFTPTVCALFISLSDTSLASHMGN